MTAAGKITTAALAARVAAGEPVRVLLDREDAAFLEKHGIDRVPGLVVAARKTGVLTLAALEVEVRMTGGHGFRGRAQRDYRFRTAQGWTLWFSPASTLILAPEDAAAVKRAHAEALAEAAEREAAALASANLVAEVVPAEAPEVSAAAIETREAWLVGAVDALRPLFAEVGETVPAVRVSVGWPGGKGKKNTVIGQCWASWTAADKVSQLFVSPVLDDAVRVLDVLAHELVHAVDDCASGHKGRFAKIAKGIGLTGKMTATVAGEELKARLAEIADKLGPYPHAKLSTPAAGAGEKPQTNRQLKVECPESGYIARTTKKWLEEVGAPLCPCHREEMVIA
ncbi:hypothetical protein [Micromonospora sediminicola]|uniref:hypothetical protein n=1 Tax=Micromonospora sediminicola TaxID=946078 RepID=UPI0037A44D1F